MNTIKRRKLYKGRVLITWLITYICLFFVLLALWFAVLGISQNILNKQNYRINENIINILFSSIEEDFESIEKLMTQMGINKQVVRKTYNQFTTDGYDAYTSKEIMDSLQECRVGHPYIKDIFLYFPQSKSVISASSASSADIYYNEYYANTACSREAWDELVNEKQLRNYYSVMKGEKYDSVLLLQTVPSVAVLKDSKSTYATLVVKIDLDVIRRRTEEFAAANSVEINIYDSQQRRLVHAASDNNRKIARTISITSEKNLWTYEMNIPTKVYFGETYYLIAFMTAALLISFLVFCILSIYFTRKNYSPLRELLDSVKEYHSFDTFDGSEYMYLHDSIRHIMENQKQDKEMLAEQMERIRTTYICRFLTGGMRRVDVDTKVFANLKLEWLLQPCMILIIKPFTKWDTDRTAMEIAQSLDIGTGEDSYLNGYSVILNKMLVVIIRSQDTQQEQQENLRKYGEHINCEEAGYYIAASSFDQTKPIGTAFDEAVYAIQYAEYLSEERVVFYNNIEEENYPRRYTYVDEWKLADAIKNQNCQEALRLMVNVWKLNTESGYLRMSDVRFLLALQLSSYFKTVCMLYPEFYQNGFPVDLKSVSEMNDKEEMQRIMEQVIASSFDKMSKYSVENKEERLKLEVMQYIEENFRNPELTVDRLCRDFGKSVSYFSRIFKGISGEGILYYINSRRIQEAKYIIKCAGQNLNVNEVYEKVGFTNVNTFIRSFKKYEGMTPGKYKEMVQQIERNTNS